MTLDKKTQERIQNAQNSGKLDAYFVEDLDELLEDRKQPSDSVLYFANGKTGARIDGLYEHSSGIGRYTAQTSYTKLLDLVESKDFSRFEKSVQMRYKV